MTRTIYLIVYNSRLLPAHWSLWVPTREDVSKGKRVHVKGDVANGFELALERNYSLEDESRACQLIQLAQVDEKNVVDIAHDGIEEIALSIAPPGPSLIAPSNQGLRQRVQINNCQTWLRQVVAALVEKNIMPSEALTIVDNAPKN
ncbi:hypothetical protein EJ08DRAFT_668629 [Tothia fuscella]|uniref:Uncharacterized protein n=1 Tax=Tothia fuscella TaxID=1048955 RepID=A0A9P4NYJ5_9PEZI|nr:hypothetical protein EJ08DRAFT_668629 [Tothia fuscella]